jgi:low affinity Fe/Cu permease
MLPKVRRAEGPPGLRGEVGNRFEIPMPHPNHPNHQLPNRHQQQHQHSHSVSKSHPPGNGYGEAFRRFAHLAAELAGRPAAFFTAFAIIIAWLLTGPAFGFSDTWQLIVNTGTTIVTFLMVFLIQNAQNRDAFAFHLKLDELIRAVRGARTELVDLEELTDEEMGRLQTEFRELHEKLTNKIKERRRSP